MTFSSDERRKLAALLLELGPDAPTLCEGWTTKDLAVHLFVREHRLDATGGMFIKALKPRLDSVTAEVEQRDFADIVQGWADGAPSWNPMRLADQYVNAAENFVHHEDVRRAQPDWQPRELQPSATGDLWRVVTTLGKVLLRKSDATVVLRRADGVAATLVDKTASGGEVVTVSGDIGELVLWLYGREPVVVNIDGNVSLVHRGAV